MEERVNEGVDMRIMHCSEMDCEIECWKSSREREEKRDGGILTSSV